LGTVGSYARRIVEIEKVVEWEVVDCQNCRSTFEDIVRELAELVPEVAPSVCGE
jgi:hypothetical protein